MGILFSSPLALLHTYHIFCIFLFILFITFLHPLLLPALAPCHVLGLCSGYGARETALLQSLFRLVFLTNDPGRDPSILYSLSNLPGNCCKSEDLSM